MTLTKTLAVSALALALAACQAMPVREAPVAAPATPAPAAQPAAPAAGPGHHDNLNAVAWVQASLEYRLLAGQTYRSALYQLDRALKTPDWDALTPDERLAPVDGLPPAVIVDIDETVLDNSPYQARLVRDGAAYDEVTWDAWVREEKAKPVPGALEFAQAAAARGVTVFYLSNRAAHLEEPTLVNLRALGFPVESGTQFLGLGFFVEGCEQEGSEKGCRRKHVSRTHRVLMQFGDQIGDMVTISANTPAGREQAMAPYAAWIGERWFVLPNPTYGSWEPALFNNAWTLPEAERRQMKLDALDYAE
ncbi:5'-nucleotidase, lipoprotein e(P4) family [Arenimonas sp.]|uniref:5'-nucleotidase, lipoprotein e(P4) family n=1 Tax=Arenimonas sp. TaxID=1872635 RepID=UPI002E37C8DB|nr:HAD family acid phosphatase [Arenimonas sp.]HEX4853933.1 HAD family acid phosphatase [Arenimonas sp.]